MLSLEFTALEMKCLVRCLGEIERYSTRTCLLVHTVVAQRRPISILGPVDPEVSERSRVFTYATAPRPQAVAAQLWSMDDLCVPLHLPINCSYQRIKNYFPMYGNSLLLIITNNSSFPSIIDS